MPRLWGLLCLLVVAGLPMSAHAQDTGSVGGLVVNGWDGRPLSGVIVTLRGTILAGTTDASGRFRLEGVPVGEHTVRFSKPGFGSTTVSGVRVAPGLASNLDGSLRPEFFELEEYEVTAEQFQDQAIEILEQRQASTSFMDAISSEQFRRLGVTDAAQIITKLPGTTVVEGKFAVIRGLSDRYNITQLNGAQIPTADPYRVGAPLDIIPAAMIREVSVSKTFTPDLPGGFAGGLANLKTKSFPDKFLLNVEVGMEYNTQSTFNDGFLTYPGSPTDWAGFGTGTRAKPAALNGQTSQTLQPPPNRGGRVTPEQAQERQNQANKVQNALGSFQDYTFGSTTQAPPPNYGGNFSVGETIDLNGHDFGYFVSGVYRRRWFFYDDGEQNRYTYSRDGIVPLRELQDTQSLMESLWASVVNVAYEIVPEEHTLSFTFYWNQSGEDLTRRQVGYVDQDDTRLADLNTLYWTQRQIHAFQIQGDDYFEKLHDLRTDWLISIANTSQNEPDLRYFNYFHQPDGSFATFGNSLPEPVWPTRFYREINEDAIWASLNNRVPFKQWEDLEGFVKFGGGFNGSQREFNEDTFQFSGSSGWEGESLPFIATPNNYFTPENILYTTRTNANGTVNYDFQRKFQQGVAPSYYDGQQQIPAGYAMTELPITESFRVITGARLESTYMSVNGGTGNNITNSLISQLDVMPALSGVYQLVTNMNLRASFSQTVARPTYREIAPYRSYDPYGNEIIEGNPNLTMTDISNYDVRWEYYPNPGTVFSVSGFYKKLTDPIEKVAVTFGGGVVTFENRDEATLYGVELEANTKLDIVDSALEEFLVGFNFAYIKSEVELTPTELANKVVLFPDTPPTRPLYDQSPWIVNFDFTFDHKATGTTATVSLGAAGPFIFLVDRGGPDVYSYPPMQLNFVVTQRLSDHWRLRLSARNLLNSENLRTYGDTANSPVYSVNTLGSTIAMILTYEY